jgi:hypothetical protein
MDPNTNTNDPREYAATGEGLTADEAEELATLDRLGVLTAEQQQRVEILLHKRDWRPHSHDRRQGHNLFSNSWDGTDVR